MKAKFIVLTLMGLILVVFGTTRIKSKVQDDKLKALQEAPDRGTINWYARVAKAKGEKKINIPAQKAVYASEYRDLDEALKYNGLIIAKPVDKVVVVNDDTLIRTWYKCRIIEKLSNIDLPQCRDCMPNDLTIPQDMYPLNKDEILIPQGGGSVDADGITVVYDDPLFPQFDISRKYLLLIQTDPSGQIGLLKIGPSGVFTIDNNNRLQPINESPHGIKTEMANRYNSSIELVRDHIRAKLD
jgi:hypothetical protein